MKISATTTRILQTGRLESYMTTVFMAFAAVLLLPMIYSGELPEMPRFPGLNFYEWGIVAIAVIGLVAVLFAKDRLTAIVSLGIQGFAVALIFMLFGAPDLSFTQFMVETLSVVILALVMTRLTLHKSDHRPVGQTLLDGGIAIAAGCGFGLLLLSVTQVPFDSTLSDFFAEHSVPIAHGRNIVNVIIVDFRSLDTLGEIGVVMIAGLAILALIRIRFRGEADPSMTAVIPSMPNPVEASAVAAMAAPGMAVVTQTRATAGNETGSVSGKSATIAKGKARKSVKSTGAKGKRT